MDPTRYMVHTSTYWPVTGTDDFGNPIFGTPQVIKCRWQEKSELFITEEREELVSQAIVYLSSAVVAGGYLAEGDYSTELDPFALADNAAKRIMKRDRVDNLYSTVSMWKAYL